MSCCPATALSQLGTGDYVSKGKVTKIDRGGQFDSSDLWLQTICIVDQPLELYVVGSGPKCIVWNYDICGFDSGRTRQMADLFAEAGYLVIIPDFYRGTWRIPTAPDIAQYLKDQTNWEKLQQDILKIVLPYAKSRGATSLGALGTCWGSYMVVRECGYEQFKAGVSWHPSHSQVARLLGEDEEQLLANIQCPQLFMPAGADAESCKQ